MASRKMGPVLKLFWPGAEKDFGGKSGARGGIIKGGRGIEGGGGGGRLILRASRDWAACWRPEGGLAGAPGTRGAGGGEDYGGEMNACGGR